MSGGLLCRRNPQSWSPTDCDVREGGPQVSPCLGFCLLVNGVLCSFLVGTEGAPQLRLLRGSGAQGSPDRSRGRGRAFGAASGQGSLRDPLMPSAPPEQGGVWVGVFSLPAYCTESFVMGPRGSPSAGFHLQQILSDSGLTVHSLPPGSHLYGFGVIA